MENEEIRGKAINNSTIKTNEGELIQTIIPDNFIGKQIVKRGDIITERIDS